MNERRKRKRGLEERDERVIFLFVLGAKASSRSREATMYRYVPDEKQQKILAKLIHALP